MLGDIPCILYLPVVPEGNPEKWHADIGQITTLDVFLWQVCLTNGEVHLTIFPQIFLWYTVNQYLVVFGFRQK